ncbi:uncharacterized protein LOC129889098 [Solanum dulcamara]|uniref:uncharacterized protein LOC129889098 n=1 Tax=Solanum dulcamara TaxID=45834 RepID=UPI002486C20C|nr:uncharacterized protein LOC129889098 [Solanum dulcamara]
MEEQEWQMQLTVMILNKEKAIKEPAVNMAGAANMAGTNDIADLSTGQVKEIGKETGGLYILLDHTNNHSPNKEPNLMVVALYNAGEYLLWNKRLEHPSINVLRKMSLALEGKDNIIKDECTV